MGSVRLTNVRLMFHRKAILDLFENDFVATDSEFHRITQNVNIKEYECFCF